jgi:hypothetical protein
MSGSPRTVLMRKHITSGRNWMKSTIVNIFFTTGLILALLIPANIIIDYFGLSTAFAYGIMFVLGGISADIRHWLFGK